MVTSGSSRFTVGSGYKLNNISAKNELGTSKSNASGTLSLEVAGNTTVTANVITNVTQLSSPSLYDPT